MAKEIKKPTASKKQSVNTSHRRTSNTSKKKESAQKKEERLLAQEQEKERRMQEIAKRKEVTDEVVLIVTLLIGVVLYLSYFGKCGAIGTPIRAFIFGLMGGYLPYIFPVALFLLVAFMRSNPSNPLATKKTTVFVFAVFFVAALLHIVSGCAEKYGIFEAFKIGYKNKNGGGFIGAVLGKPLFALCGKPASIIILIVFILVCIVLITERSLFATIKRRRAARKQSYAEYEEYEAEISKRISEQDLQQMTLDEIQEANRKRLVLVDAAPAETTPDYDFYEAPRKKKSKKKSFLDRLMETGGKKISEEDTSADMKEITQRGEKDKHVQNSGQPEETYLSQNASNHYADIMPAGDVFFSDVTIAKELSDEDEVSTHSDDALDYGQKTIQKLDNPVSAEKHSVSRERHPEKENSQASNSLQVSGTQKDSPDASAVISPAPISEKPYVFPPLSLLKRPQEPAKSVSNSELKETAIKLQNTLDSFGVKAKVTGFSCGPTVTRYELQPEQGVKVSRITALADDIKLNLAAADIRIEAPIPGKAAVGIEIPNSKNSMVMLRTLLESSEYQDSKAGIAFAVGKDIGGSTIVTDITKMPHLLIAGQTGSGKSVCVNTLIMSILYKYSPEEVRLIMIDPKVVELIVYNGIPHLWAPVVTDPKIASATLNWAVKEMGERYQLFAHLGVRNMEGFNEKIKNSTEPVLDKEGNPLKRMAHLVIIVDELADLMMVAKGDVEDSICRLAQLARAAGIHLVIATQRPSVNVITGTIKANVPSRIAFSVASSIDSRTILDQVGAEKLLGKGDMLFAPAGLPTPARVQGAYVGDSEITAVVEFLKENNQQAESNDNLANHLTSGACSAGDAPASERDEYFEEAGRLIIEKDKASIGMLQRMYKIGFNRAARIMDQLADAGVVGPEEGTKPRKILMSIDEFEDYMSL